MRVKCLAQEHNTMSPARARTRTARSGVERTNHDATAPPTFASLSITYLCSLLDITVLCSVTWSLNGSEAGGDLALTQTSLLLLCKRSKLYILIYSTKATKATGRRRVIFDRISTEIHRTIVARIYVLNLWLIQVTIKGVSF